MRKLITFFAVTFGALVLGCPNQEFFPKCDDPTNPCPVVEPDYPEYPAPGKFPIEEPEGSTAMLSSPCGKACANFRAIGCSDGQPKAGITCYRGCLSMARHQRIPTMCWTMAKSVVAVRECGGIRCLP